MAFKVNRNISDWFLLKYLFLSISVKLAGEYRIPDKSWNHMELIWGTEVGKYVNMEIVKILDRY